MITPRSTRLVRTRSLAAYQHAIQALCTGDPVTVRRTLVLVPSGAAALRLRATLEARQLSGVNAAAVLPDVLTRAGMYERCLPSSSSERWLTPFEREMLLEAGAHAAITDGAGPPFHLRPSLIGEMLELYDDLLRYQQTIEDFERLLETELEPQASSDRGAERMLRQTRFLAAAFRWYATAVHEIGAVDEHGIRARMTAGALASPWRHIVVTVGDRAAERGGLWPADFDLLTRAPGIERIDVVATEGLLAVGLHTRIHDLLPGIDEVRFESQEPLAPPAPLEVPRREERRYFVSRDREEELSDAIRRIRRLRREERDPPRLDRTAIVFARPLPYLYLARELFASAGLPFQGDDTLPLAAEPIAAAVDVVLTFVSAEAGREAAMALLRSPHLTFAPDADPREWPDAVAALDAALAEAGHRGGVDRLRELAAAWTVRTADDGDRAAVCRQRAAPALVALVAAAGELAPLFARHPAAAQLHTLLQFLTRHRPSASPDDERDRRARGAVEAILENLAAAYARNLSLTWDIDQLTAVVHRWIEAHTFQPRRGDEGVHLIDAVAARYGAFDDVHLVGLIEGEWPERPRRNIFYSSFLLRRLGWREEGRAEADRAAFSDLLRLAARRTTASTVLLENEAIAEPSALLDELHASDLPVIEADAPPRDVHVFVHEALLARTVPEAALSGAAARWVTVRRAQRPPDAHAFHGRALPHVRREHGVSAIELYTQCPFRYFARHVLRLDEEPAEADGLSPRDRGIFVHEVMQRFFEGWRESGRGSITPDTLDEARAALEAAAEPLLARLAPVDAALERARLFGSAAAPGVADLVLRMEAERPTAVIGRRLEERFSGTFDLQSESGVRTIAIRGIIDRVDMLADGSVRVLDYKSYVPLAPLQLAIYTATALQRLRREQGRAWGVDEAAYVVYGGRREIRSIAARGQPVAEALADAQRRFIAAVDAVASGEFPVDPLHTRLCPTCAFQGVCRREYVVQRDQSDGPPPV